jgi:hypothetical protein
MPELTRIKDTSLFVSHDIVNILVFLFLLGLPYFSADILVQNYMTGKIIHLLGLMWFYGGLILTAFCLSRFVWTQPSLDHDKLAYGYRIMRMPSRSSGPASIALIIPTKGLRYWTMPVPGC